MLQLFADKAHYMNSLMNFLVPLILTIQLDKGHLVQMCIMRSVYYSLEMSMNRRNYQTILLQTKQITKIMVDPLIQDLNRWQISNKGEKFGIIYWKTSIINSAPERFLMLYYCTSIGNNIERYDRQCKEHQLGKILHKKNTLQIFLGLFYS